VVVAPTWNLEGSALWAAHTSLGQVLATTARSANQAFQRKAFVSSLTSHGLEELTLRESIASVKRTADTIQRAHRVAQPL